MLASAGISVEDVLVAAFLHDVVEDEPVGRGEIDAGFGVRVGDLVCAMTEPTEDAAGRSLDWGERKASIVETAQASDDADLLDLKAADLICNASDLIGEYERIGDAVFARFPPHGGHRHVGYYLDLARTLDARPLNHKLAVQVRALIAPLEDLSTRAAGAPSRQRGHSGILRAEAASRHSSRPGV